MTATAEAQPLFAPLPLHRQLMWWTVAFPVVMIVAVVERSFYLLNWIHVLSGALWTGADLFMGFVIGPVLRSLDMRARTAVIAYLVPRTLLYFPMVSLTTGTAGWLLASSLGFLVPGNAQFPWAIAALVLVTIMTIQGLAVMLPNSLRIWRELRGPEPNRERIMRLNRTNVILAGAQGLMQVAIIVVMAHFVVG
ncbi:MAG: hypothetical protein ACYDG0_03505 [Vulcanimicrobiaceae bacterium]